MYESFDDTEIIAKYTVQQAVEDGVLVEIFKKRSKDLSGGEPIVATTHIYEDISLSGLLEIWNEFVTSRKSEMPALAEEDRHFVTTMNGEKVWVMEDVAAFRSCIRRIIEPSGFGRSVWRALFLVLVPSSYCYHAPYVLGCRRDDLLDRSFEARRAADFGWRSSRSVSRYSSPSLRHQVIVTAVIGALGSCVPAR